MKNVFSFSRRDRNGLMLLLIFIVASVGVASLFSYRSIQEKKKQQDFLLSSSRYLAELQVVGIELPKAKIVNMPMENSVYEYPAPVLDKKKTVVTMVELNSADSAMLVSLPGVGAVFATRILKYKSMLGGYYDSKQLLEVYGFDSDRYENLKSRVAADTTLITKLNINSDAFKAILKHPYIDYDMTKRIFKARDKNLFSDIDDFAARASIDDSSLMKLDHYLNFH